jgi:hypothetical protein
VKNAGNNQIHKIFSLTMLMVKQSSSATVSRIILSCVVFFSFVPIGKVINYFNGIVIIVEGRASPLVLLLLPVEFKRIGILFELTTGAGLTLNVFEGD